MFRWTSLQYCPETEFCEYSIGTFLELQERTGEVAVITGGARGIGAEVVKQLLQCNMHVIIGEQIF